MNRLSRLMQRYPPVLVRLLAKHHGRAMSTEAIAKSSGLNPVSVLIISREWSWTDIRVGDMLAFTRGCNLDLVNTADINRAETYLRKNGGRPKFEYLVKSDEWKTYYLPLIVSWRRSLQSIPDTLPSPVRRMLTNLKV